MSDLNLNFDCGLKTVTMGSSNGDNIQISSPPPTSPPLQSIQPTQNQPNLSVSDPMGVEFLTKGSAQMGSGDNTPKSTKSEEFNFFKPSEEPKTDENLPKPSSDTDDMLFNPNKS